jgi:hypothetical protein
MGWRRGLKMSNGRVSFVLCFVPFCLAASPWAIDYSGARIERVFYASENEESSIREASHDDDDSGYFDTGDTWEDRDPAMVCKLTFNTTQHHRAENQPPRHTSRAP